MLRRGAKPYSLVAWLVHSGDIMNVLSSTLTELLGALGIRMARLTTKAAKIRRLMTLPEVTEKCHQSEIDMVEALLLEQEQKRNKKDADNDDAELKENQDCSVILSLFFVTAMSPHI